MTKAQQVRVVPTKADEPLVAKLWRMSGLAVTWVSSVLLVEMSQPAVQRAVSGEVADSFALRLRNAKDDLVLVNDIRSQIDSASLDRELVVYLGVAALIAVAGAALRVFAHGAPLATLKGGDFAGKCLALSGAIIALSAAWRRFGDAGVSAYLPAGVGWLVLIGGLVVLVLLWFVGVRDELAREDSK